MKRAATVLLGVCVAVGHAGCQGTPPARSAAGTGVGTGSETTSGPVVAYTGQDLHGMVGTRIRATGIAVNGKYAGAVVPAEFPLYVDGVSEWPRSVVGKTVEVTGTVDRIPEPPPGGGGIVGGIILRDAHCHQVK